MARKRRFIIDIDEETNKKKLVIGDIVLLIIFGCLIALVVSLFLTVMKKKDEPTNIVADLVVPIVEENTKNEFSVNLAEVKNNKYILKVTNYRKDDINDKEFSYDLEVVNDKKIDIEIYKNQVPDNLATTNSGLILEKNILGTLKKQEDVYKIVVVDDKKLTSKDTLKIIISS